MRRAVFADNAGAVYRKNNSCVLKRDIVYYLVK